MHSKNNIGATVTVVMAVYNSAGYVNEAIESVKNQTYENWRMICVDDGSTDNSLEILREAARTDRRITVFSKSNGGAASARAVAFAQLQTPFAIILDSDDVYSPDLLQILIDCAEETGADSIATNLIIEQPDGSYMNWNKRNGLKSGDTFNGHDAFKMSFMCAKLHGVNMWKSDLLKAYGVGENACFSTMNADEYIQRVLYLNCNKIVVTDAEYVYRNNEKSTTKRFSFKQIGYIDTCRRYIDLCKNYSIDSETTAIVMEYYLRHLIHLQMRLFKENEYLKPAERAEMRKRLKDSYAETVPYHHQIKFADKKIPFVYRMSALNGYGVFMLTCFIFSKLKH